MSYTQEELTSIWQRLTDDPERDEFGELDVSEMVESFRLSMLSHPLPTIWRISASRRALRSAFDRLSSFFVRV